MAKQLRGSQYDDDLTVGLDDIADDSFDTGYVDLFEYAGDEESPISRLKTIMLSIEWEITDEVLISFNDELQAAQQEWSNDQVKLVYIQALQKICRYIYQKKADAHHNAMKVMLSFFYDLEKIVLDTTISEEEKRKILREDVSKFELLKQQLGFTSEPGDTAALKSTGVPAVTVGQTDSRVVGETNPDLYNLKANILSIDWEITDRELSEISNEVGKLQQRWSASKPQMLLLQGIDALGGYIKLMKHEAHGDAFKLLNSFYQALETVVDGNPGNQETKNILLAEAGKFSLFKDRIRETITPEAIAAQRRRMAAGDDAPGAPDTGAPADDRLDIDNTSEFEQTSFAEDIGAGESFSEETLEKVTSFFGDLEAAAHSDFASISPEEALRGVEVESDADEEDEEDELPTLGNGMVAPALAGLEDDDADPVEPIADSPASIAQPIVGVDVETEADDDTDEAPLLFDGEDPAPALSGGDDAIADGFGAPADEEGEGEINRHVDDFFSSEIFGESGGDAAEPGVSLGEEFSPALNGVDVDDDDGVGHGQFDQLDEALSPALSGFDDDMEDDFEGDRDSDDIESRLDSFLSEDTDLPGQTDERDGTYAALNSTFDALKNECSETNITAIKAAVEEARQALNDRPIEKTLTQLISTVVHNIDGESAGSDDDAVELLQSVFTNLGQIRTMSVDQDRALELLAGDTEKILQWQQQRLSR